MMQSIVRAFFKITLLTLARLIYRQRVFHAERVPETGGVLLISNHTTYIDSFLIYETCPRPVRFVIVSRFMRVPAVGWFVKLFGAIPIQHGRPREAIRKTVEALAAGDVVCIFPEGQLTRTGTLLELKKGYQLIAEKSGARVVPLFIDGLWGSIYSCEGGRLFWKWPRRLTCPVRIAFGEPVAPEDASLEWAREALLKLSAEAFSARKELDLGLGEAVVRALKQRPGAPCFIEHGKRRRLLKRGQVLAIAAVLAARWRESLPEDEERIGILLPPGWAPAVMNLALVFSRRVPIHLPFDAESFDSEKLAGHLHGLGIRSVVTSKAFASQLAHFPWRETEGQFIDMGGELSSSNLVQVLFERLLARIEPKWMAVRRFEVGESSREIACGYLPKGSSEPVMLSSRAVIANALRLSSGDFVRRHERILCEAPLSSAAGMAFALWLPVLRGTSCSSRSFVLQASRSMIETVVSEDAVTLLAGNELFLDQLEALEEAWHPELREAVRAVCFFPKDHSGPALSGRRLDRVESNTGAPVCIGWAPDSLGMVVSAGFPDVPVDEGSNLRLQAGRRDGAAGRLLPGIAPATDGDGGLRLEGAGFGGSEPVETGLKVRLDEEGFLFPEENGSK